MTIVSTISGDYTGADDTLASLPHCATCMDVIVGATTTECGHDVCYTGIKELEQRHEKPSFPMSLLDHTLFHCPECRGPVESTSRSFEFDAMIEQLVVKYAAPGVLGSYFERKEQYQRFIDNEREEKKRAEAMIEAMRTGIVQTAAAVCVKFYVGRMLIESHRRRAQQN